MAFRNCVRNGVEDFHRRHEQFDRDRGGRMGVRIDGLGEISRDYETARDQLVQFITGNDDETFGTAAESVQRRTGLLMSILSQFTASSVTTAFQNAIERPGLTYQLAGNSAGGAERPRLTASAGV